jgi:hypothetical protein
MPTPNTGYIIECTSTASGCPSGIPWFPIGGHQRRRAADGRHHGGRQHFLAIPRRPADGIREPLPLQQPEHVLGHHRGQTNSINGSGLYKAAVGYDPATGLGSPNADTLANALAAFTPAPVNPDETNLVVTSPTATQDDQVRQEVTLAGTLTDSTETRRS